MTRMRGLLAFGTLIVGVGCNKPDAPAVAQQSAPPAVRHEERVFAAGLEPTIAPFTNPVASNKKTIAEGEKLFNSMNCDGCHGGGATGWVGPSLIAGRWRYGGTDAALFESIYYGRPQGMPSFGGILQPEIIWRIVTYIKAQPPPKYMPTVAW